MIRKSAGVELIASDCETSSFGDRGYGVNPKE